MEINIIEAQNLEKFNYIISIDGVGRGPLAGPLTVGGVLMDNESLTKIEKLKTLKKIIIGNTN